MKQIKQKILIGKSDKFRTTFWFAVHKGLVHSVPSEVNGVSSVIQMQPYTFKG